MALIGGVSSADVQNFNGPPYWDNTLLGYSSVTGTYGAAPEGDAMTEIEDNQSRPGYKSDLQLIQDSGYPGVTFRPRRASLSQEGS